MLEDLVEVLQLLAEPPQSQIPHIEAFRRVAEDLRDGVRELVHIDAQLERRGALPPAAGSRIRELDACFDRMVSAREDMFTERALRTAPEWAEVRRLAGEALAALGR